jgi:hypothetical protein
MPPRYRRFFLFSAGVSLSVFFAYGQDSPSLGDVARQSRQQKQQQNKNVQGKVTQVKTSKVITNEEMPDHSGAVEQASASSDTGHRGNGSSASSGGEKLPADQWKSQILAEKSQISSIQSEIDKLNDSIHFAPGNCVSGCVQWDERQKEKQQDVERMRTQLEEQKKRLEAMQESARQQGYGSSVSDP